MAVSKKQDDCVHTFEATKEQSILKIESVGLGINGKIQKLDVPATVFKCSKCGSKKNYPDIWGKSFRLITT